MLLFEEEINTEFLCTLHTQICHELSCFQNPLGTGQHQSVHHIQSGQHTSTMYKKSHRQPSLWTPL